MDKSFQHMPSPVSDFIPIHDAVKCNHPESQPGDSICSNCGEIPVSIQEEIARHDRVRAHWQTLSPSEYHKRRKLCRQAEKLVARLAERMQDTVPISRSRYFDALQFAILRAQRRAIAYYGEL